MSKRKRGLSSVVTTVILVLLIIAALGAVWFVINNFLTQGTSQIEFGGLTLDLVIKNATINYETGIATVQVTRNPDGTGEEIISIKFIAEDRQNAEVFEKDAQNLVELSQRTFELNLSESDILNLLEVHKISIAPVYIPGASGSGGSGQSRTGGIADSVGDLNIQLNGSQQQFEIVSCTQASDCGVDAWLDYTQICNGDNTGVNQYKTIFSCVLEFCQSTVTLLPKEDCSQGNTCYEGACVPETNPCTNLTIERDCGIDGFVGFPACAVDLGSIVQDHRIYDCIDEECTTSTISQLIEECEGEEICYNVECFVPLECTKNEDCSFGEVCEEGSCVEEQLALNGTVFSSWPFGLGEYFDSADFPLISEIDYWLYYVIFPGSLETRCLEVSSFVDSPTPGAYSYIRLNESKTNVSSDDYFEIWETAYGCTFI